MESNTNLRQWNNRINVGKAGEAVWEEFCTTGSLIFEQVGYECTHSEEEIAELKSRRDHDALFVRHYPDYLVEGKLVQVKTAPSQPTSKYKAVTVEADSFDVSSEISAAGSPVLLVYVYGDGTLHANWISEIKTREPYSQSGAGSGTPYLLVDKKYLKPIEEFEEIFKPNLFAFAHSIGVNNATNQFKL